MSFYMKKYLNWKKKKKIHYLLIKKILFFIIKIKYDSFVIKYTTKKIFCFSKKMVYSMFLNNEL